MVGKWQRRGAQGNESSCWALAKVTIISVASCLAPKGPPSPPPSLCPPTAHLVFAVLFATFRILLCLFAVLNNTLCTEVRLWLLYKQSYAMPSLVLALPRPATRDEMRPLLCLLPSVAHLQGWCSLSRLVHTVPRHTPSTYLNTHFHSRWECQLIPGFATKSHSGAVVLIEFSKGKLGVSLGHIT